MTDKKKNGWMKFVPSLDLPKERVSIAYDTHDERGVRYAYGYFQFYNGTCGCFWKDGNEQPKVIKAEDIKYWMPVPSLDVQEEPKSFDEAIQEGDDMHYNEDLGCRVNLSRLKRVAKKEATGKLKECIDNITDESLAKARKQLQEESKVCMYSKDNYTDEDRKALCGSCEEECIYKINEERKRDLSLWSLGDFENNFFEIINPYKDSHNYKNLCIRLVVWRRELWRWIHWKKRKEEPVSEDFKQFEDEYLDKEKDEILCIYDRHAGLIDGANWQKQQFEKNRLKHCNGITNEQAELEQGFIDQHLDKHQRMPTFLDAIEYGKELQKELMMAKAVDTEVKIDAGGYPYVDATIELYDYDKDIPLAKEGDKYKVVLIREE